MEPYDETRALSNQTWALSNQTRALSNQTRPLPNQTLALSNQTRALPNQTRAMSIKHGHFSPLGATRKRLPHARTGRARRRGPRAHPPVGGDVGALARVGGGTGRGVDGLANGARVGGQWARRWWHARRQGAQAAGGEGAGGRGQGGRGLGGPAQRPAQAQAQQAGAAAPGGGRACCEGQVGTRAPCCAHAIRTPPRWLALALGHPWPLVAPGLRRAGAARPLRWRLPPGVGVVLHPAPPCHAPPL